MKNKWIFVFLICGALFLSGCWDKTEFTQVSFAVAMAIDKTQENYEVTVKLMLPKEESQNGDAQVWLVSGKGASIYEAIEELNNRSPREVYWGHMSLVVLGSSINEDISSVLDYFSRASQFRRSEYIVCADTKGAEMLSASNEQSEVNDFYIYTLLRDMEMRYHDAAVDLNDCLLQRNYQGRAYLLPLLGLAEPNSINKDEKAPYIKGAMLIKNDKALTELDNDDFAGYRFLKCAISQGSLVTDNPLGEGKLSYNIKKSRAKLSWQNDTLLITIKGTVNLTERLGSGEAINEKDSERKLMEESINRYVEKKVKACMEESVAQNADFLYLGQWLSVYHNRAFEQYDDENYLKELKIEIKSDLKLKFSVLAD